MAVAILGYHSQKYLRATEEALTHAAPDSHRSLFIILPGCGQDTGCVRIKTAGSRSCFLYCTGEGQQGLWESENEVTVGDSDATQQFWWKIEVDEEEGLFALQSVASERRLFSNSDGRLWCWIPMSDYPDQLFTLEGKVHRT